MTLALLAALAATLPVQSAPPRPLARTSVAALLVEGGIAVGALVAEETLLDEAGPRCRWCAANPFDETARASFRLDDPRRPARASHLLSGGVAPGLGAGVLVVSALAADSPRTALEDVAIVANAVVTTFAVTGAAKVTVRRQRPAWHFGREAETEFGDQPEQANLSFFSGDTSLAFASVAASTTVAALRGYRAAPWLGVAGGSVAVTVAGLRMAGDLHWASDVLSGAAVGTLIGVGLPLLLHGRVDAGAETDGAASGDGALAGATGPRLAPFFSEAGGGLALDLSF